MARWWLVFLALAVIFGALAFGGIGGDFAGTAQVLFFAALVAMTIDLARRRRPGDQGSVASEIEGER